RQRRFKNERSVGAPSGHPDGCLVRICLILLCRAWRKLDVQVVVCDWVGAPFKAWVAGSNPAALTKNPLFTEARRQPTLYIAVRATFLYPEAHGDTFPEPNPRPRCYFSEHANEDQRKRALVRLGSKMLSFNDRQVLA